jgi:hypothetical protein
MTNPRVALLLHLDLPPMCADADRLGWWERTGARLLTAVLETDQKVGLALSGSVVDWLHGHRGKPLERLRSAVASGAVELVACPFYEPVLSSIPGSDGTDQILAHVTATRRLIDVRPRGCWLPQRVWDPEVPRLMKRADIDWTVVEDGAVAEHHVQQGIDPWGAWRTERGGHALGLLANDVGASAMRGASAPDELGLYLQGRASQGARDLCFAWSVRRSGHDVDADVDWLVGVLRTLEPARVVIPSQMAADLRGRVYLPSWAPPEVGCPWEHRLLRSAAADRLHKRMLRVSRLLTRLSKRIRRHDPDAPDPDRIVQARRYLHRAQGGCHFELDGVADAALRARAWHDLLRAEGLAEAAAHIDRRLVAESIDLRTAGYEQVMLRTPAGLAVVDPRVGGGLTELCHLPSARNVVDCDDGEGGAERAAFVERLEGELPPGPHEVLAVERAADSAVRTVLARDGVLGGQPVRVHKAFSLRVEPRLDVVFEVHAEVEAEGELIVEVPLVCGAEPEGLEVTLAGEQLLLEEADGPRQGSDALLTGGHVDACLSARRMVRWELTPSPLGATVQVWVRATVAPDRPFRLDLKLELGPPGSLAGRGHATSPPPPPAQPSPTPSEPVPQRVAPAPVPDPTATPAPAPRVTDDLLEAPTPALRPLVAPPALLDDDDDEDDDEAFEQALGDTIVLQKNVVVEPPAAPAHLRAASPATQRPRSLVPPRRPSLSLSRPRMYHPGAPVPASAEAVEAQIRDELHGEGGEQ